MDRLLTCPVCQTANEVETDTELLCCWSCGAELRPLVPATHAARSEQSATQKPQPNKPKGVASPRAAAAVQKGQAWKRGQKVLGDFLIEGKLGEGGLAWGLHAVHELGILHQDVKPGNTLLTRERTVRVTDFGLARARAALGPSAGPVQQSILVSTGGMTPAYCSPEQAAGQRLGRGTDIWSWGLSVVEMFCGDVCWRSGTEAPQVLEALRGRGPDPPLPELPAAVVPVLARCFLPQPSDR